jgi:hypothetical protein
MVAPCRDPFDLGHDALARFVEQRADDAHGAAESAGDLGQGHALHLVQEEHFAFLRRDEPEEELAERQRFPVSVASGLVQELGRCERAAASHSLARGVQQAARVARAAIGSLLPYHREHLLQGFIEVRLAHAEVTQTAVREPGVLEEQLAEP